MPRRPVSSWLRGSVAEAIVADLLGEDGVVVDVGLHRAGPRRRPGRRSSSEAIGVWERRCAPKAQQRSQTAPSAAIARSDHRRLPAATRVTPKHREGHAGRAGRRRTRHHADDDQVRARAADRRRAASRCRSRCSSASPSGSNGRSKAVKNPMSRTFRMTTSAEHRADDRGQDASGGARAGRAASAMRTRPSSGSLRNPLGVRSIRLVRSDEGAPHEQRRRGS